MRPALLYLLVALLLSCGPASAGFEPVPNSGFEEIDSGPLTNWASYGPGVAWGDYDQDGDLDVFLTARFDHLGQETALALGFPSMGDIPENDFWNTFNLGVGFCLVVSDDGVNGVLEVCQDKGLKAWSIGRIQEASNSVMHGLLGLPYLNGH